MGYKAAVKKEREGAVEVTRNGGIRRGAGAYLW